MLGGTAGQFGSGRQHRLRCDHRRHLLADAQWRRGSIHLTDRLRRSRRVQPQLGSVLVVELVRRHGRVRYDSTAAANYCAAYAVALPVRHATYTCNPNYNLSMLGFITRWTPVKNLTLSAETIWTHLDTGFKRNCDLPAGSPDAASTLAFKSQDTMSLNFAFSATSDHERLTTSQRTPGRKLPGVFLETILPKPERDFLRIRVPGTKFGA